MLNPTAESIRAMTAGPEMDALVAEHVMGCREKRRSNKRGGWLYDLVVPGDVNCVDFIEPGACWSACPRYSTDPAANAELKRHLWAKGVLAWSLSALCGAVILSITTVSVSTSHTEPIVTDPIAAEMLCWCKAALLAAIEEGRAG